VRRATITGTVVAVLSLVATWWSTANSVRALGTGTGAGVCPAIYPMPSSCRPEYHVRVSAILSAVVAAVDVAALAAIRRTRQRTAAVGAAVLVGLLAWAGAATEARFTFPLRGPRSIGPHRPVLWSRPTR